VDGTDWLGAGALGLDPPDLARELSQDGRLRVGRCECGVVGCVDITVEVQRIGLTVQWTALGRDDLTFGAEQYDQERHRFCADRSWEPLGRQVERVVGEIFEQAMLDDGFRFAWASTRIEPGLVHLSFERANEQRLMSFAWSGGTLESGLAEAHTFYDAHFRSRR
jgi:hypothetical protein